MLDWITNTIAAFGYLGIALLMMLENILPPIPSEVIVPLAAFTATQGKLNLLGVIISGTIGSVLGTIPWYFVGSHVGERRLRRWIDRYGKWVALSSKDLDRLQQGFKKYGAAIVLFGRLLPAIRTYVSIPAGLEAMPWFIFLLYSSIGTLAWVSLLAIAGYSLGQNFHLIQSFLSSFTNILFIVFSISLIVWFIKRQKLKKHPKNQE
ncbi:MAG: DedA family protein [Oscillatoriales cyanobacterium C42_A2020_001]|nr:DedA family protein [Leptolyngbyaceae cyanobacterium C42_A2020_001]